MWIFVGKKIIPEAKKNQQKLKINFFLDLISQKYLETYYRSSICQNTGEKTFLSRFAFRDLGASQQLTPGKKLWLLFENLLQKRNCVAKIPQLNRRYRLEPQVVLCFTQLLFCLDRHRTNISRRCAQSLQMPFDHCRRGEELSAAGSFV